MNAHKKTELSKEELEKVNKIIAGIQTDLNHAIEKLRTNDFEGALESINKGITKSNCPLCKRELSILIADIIHNKQICILKADTCKDEQKLVINKAIELKEDFVPVIQTKKAIKDKKEVSEFDKKLKFAITNNEPKTAPIPLPHEILKKLIYGDNYERS